jgi:uncharacterized membrane protein YkvA (DUF1232 family)
LSIQYKTPKDHPVQQDGYSSSQPLSTDRRLLKDARVNIWCKAALIVLPMGYTAIPLAIEIPNIVPVVGLVDDLALIE